VFLQEVQGRHERHASRFPHWPKESQHEFLAGGAGRRSVFETAYGRNASYLHGHHGNALLSRFPILHLENRDVSDHSLENRGILHCIVSLPACNVHCFVVHFGLLATSRARQAEELVGWIEREVPVGAPVIVAGDFNDWRMHARSLLAEPLRLAEVFEVTHGGPARTFPCVMPLLHLDRIYVRGFRVRRASVHHGHPWSRISDHAVLSATIVRV
jgi:endonuclease/exonuclease/phosphatase family metal-dependent hydrolase